MNLLQIQNGHKAYGPKVLFENETFAINEGEHVGVIGPNGAGKTTLFKILVGEESLDQGDFIKAKALRLGYLAQETDWDLSQSAEGFLQENCSLPFWQIKQLGLSLGLKKNHFTQPLSKLSGGFRMRVQLLFLVGREPNLMLLDEPTNFLDLESLMALEKFLQSYEGAFLLISHDREFLRRVTDHTLEIEQGEITKFPGNIDDYFEQKTQLRLILQRQMVNQEQKKKSIEDFVRRFGAKATKAKQAQSRLKRLDKMESIALKDLPVMARIQVPKPSTMGKEIFQLQNADLGYQSANAKNKVLSVTSLRMERGDHIGVVGFNGVGKSTLIKSLSGKIPFLSGELKWGHQVKIATYAQHSTESLVPTDNVLQALQGVAHAEVTQQEILNMAGSLLFSGDAIYKPISVLSGGEKSRVALGQILLSKANVLLLDEPTNHLDFETVEALTSALHNYEGGLIIVSHDRGFIGRVATKILEIYDGKLELYPGTYDDYCWSLERGALSNRLSSEGGALLPQEPTEPSTSPQLRRNIKEERKRIESLLLSARRQMMAVEKMINHANIDREKQTATLILSQGDAARVAAIEISKLSNAIEKMEEDLLLHLEAEERYRVELEQLNRVARGDV